MIGANVITKDMLNKTPGYKDVQNTSMLYVFSLDKGFRYHAPRERGMMNV